MSGDDPYRYTDPATTQLPASGAVYPSRTSGWVEDPAEPSGWRYVRDLTAAGQATELLPVVPLGRIDFEGATDWAWPQDGEDAEVAVPPRVDDWCEDRGPDELTEDDGLD